jgi:excinuclease UvrABC ATPase subunit
MSAIEIRGARENNLKNVSLDIPKGKITVFTGVSGSGKSSLVFGTIAAESQRLVQETFPTFVQQFMQRVGPPEVDSLANLSAAIVVDQQRIGGNARSTVGTVTDAAPMLRLLYARIGEPRLSAPGWFSFNDPRGMCNACEGLGQVATIAVDALVDPSRSLAEGALLPREYAVGSWFWRIVARSGYFDLDKKVRDYSEAERARLLHGPDAKIDVDGLHIKFEGIVDKVRRLLGAKDPEQLQPHVRAEYDRIFTRATCLDCGGTRLGEVARTSRIRDQNIADCTAMQVSELATFVRSIDAPRVAPLIEALATRLDHLVTIGLGYLSLDRESATLSGGESQRVKMVRHLGSSLTEITYVFDEPSVGLHPDDVGRLQPLLAGLRDKGNTVLVVEHEPDVIALADHVVDMGPGAGEHGGRVVYQGSVAGLAMSGTATGDHLARRQPLKTAVRTPRGHIAIEGARLHNLQGVDVKIPTGVLTAVTGVAGSGKSSLVRGCLARVQSGAILVDQSLARGSRRSNTATFTGILEPIRKAFAKANGVDASLFSANSKGACTACQGLGVIYTDLAHLEPVAVVCEDCDGRRFTDEVLVHHLRGRSIGDVYAFSVTEAVAFFREKAVTSVLRHLVEVGLGYLTLGQPVSTLSGGERQRLKLARELERTGELYVIDEPTSGLHLQDVERLIVLFDRLVDAGSTVVVIEHNLDVVARADWVIDMGPGAGHAGGRVVFEGTPRELVSCAASVTGRHLARRA